ncbi:MAG: tetratricopeptide repeat protein [Candidatus Symbiothrix sp.]|nr:tetratricopeptide repeat protein [Candidatus Symbiothrix sp.]
MKKIVFLCCLLCAQLVVAQRSESISSENLLREGQQMYADQNYVGCVDKLSQLKKETSLNNLEIEYLLLASTFRLGELDDAAPLIAFAKAHPQSIHTNELSFMIADVLFGENNPDAAEKWLNQCDITALSHADKKRYVFYTGVLELKNGKYDAAATCFEPLKNDPAFQQDLPYYLAQIDFAKGNYAAVIRNLKPLIDKHPDAMSTEDFGRLGLSLYKEGDYQAAVYYLDQHRPAENAFGQNVYLALGQSYMQLNNTNRALQSFETAAGMDADPRAKEAAMYNYAMLLHQTSSASLSESVEALENFLNAYPQSEYADQVYDALTDAYWTFGAEEFTKNRYDAAIGYFNQSIAVGNSISTDAKAKAIYWRGESYYRKGNFTQAIKDYKDYLTANKTGELAAAANYGLGYCAFKQKNYTQAESYFKTFVGQEKLDKASLADGYARLGDCYFEKRRFQEAEKAYSQAEKLAPAAADYALFQKGYMLGIQKNYKGKIAQMDDLMRRSPQSSYIPNALYEKGRAQVMLDDDKEAISTYQSLLKRYPNTDEARKAGLEIGLLYYNAHDTQQASAAYKQVIAKYPDSDEAKVALQDLKSVYFDANDVSGYADYIRSLGGEVTFDADEQDKLTYLSAERFVAEKNPEKAQEALENYLKKFPEGAYTVESFHHLATIYFDKQQYPEAKAAIQSFLEQKGQKGVADGYATATSFIMLSDIHVAENDLTQARHYLESLQANYTITDDGILQQVEERLKKLKQ